MKKISIVILVLVAAFVSCKKTPEVNLKYVDIERDLVTVGTTTANIQCDYDYISTLKKAYLYYGEGEEETDMTSAEMQVVQNTLYVELASLKENTTYHYYYEFVNGFNSMRSVLKIFKTEAGSGGGGGGSGGDYEYVDLGLPSGTLWAKCNVGANSPEEYGDYFAWGETETKNVYNWSTYKWCVSGDREQLNKYCTISNFGYNGFTDNLTILEVLDDAAAANWSDDWVMPTDAQWQELFDHTTHIWTIQGGVRGCLFTANNGANLFLPAAGNHWEGNFFNDTIIAAYWSNSLCLGDPITAYYTYIDSDDCRLSSDPRFGGHSVRAVRKGSSPILPSGAPEGAINGLFSINEHGDQVYFSKGNLQYQATTNTWRFAENQWDYVGDATDGTVYESGVKCNNEQISSTYDGWIDLFGWGTSGWNSGANCYQPWSTSFYYGDYYPGGNNNNNLSGEYSNADWGFYNAISNGGNQTEYWRTLLKEEYDFVLNNRNTLSGTLFVKANVNDVNGVILLPDDWDNSYYSFNEANQGDVSFSSNLISLSQWNILERFGAVFFPAAGYRDGTYIGSLKTNGDYWTASYIDYWMSYGVEFSEYICYVDDDNTLNGGRTVRLAHDAK